jgi:hypothetical protein
MAEFQRGCDRGRFGRRRLRLGVALAAALLAAPAAWAQTDPDGGYATQPFTPQNFTMPGGEGCSGDVARCQAVQANDYSSGNIGLKVYRQIQAEIARADAACRSGRDGEASAMIHASKRRHGYPD